MKKLMIVLMLVLVVSIMGCGQPATTADTTTGVADAADTTADTVDDIEQEIAAIDELESDLDLSELDSLAADLEI